MPGLVGQLLIVNVLMFNVKLNYILLLAILLFGVVFVSGCTQTGQVTQTTTPSGTGQEQSTSDVGSRQSNAKFIGYFIATADESNIEARFSLMDSNKTYVSGDGIGQVRIVNSEGESVYTGTINVKAEDFRMYTLILTGKDILGFVWKIPISQIKKSISSSGTIYLKFRTFEELDTPIWGLPTYSENELAQLNEQEFSKSDISVNKSLSKGDFQVNITRFGYFKPINIEPYKENEYFRVDMEVKNIGSETDYFSPSGLAILDGLGNQYDMEYGGTLDTYSQFYPGTENGGYLLFENIAKFDNLTLVFKLGYNEVSYKPYFFEFKLT